MERSSTRHRFGNADTLKALLVDGGFREVSVETFSHDVKFADGALFARLNAMAVIGMSEKGKGLNESARSELAGQIAGDSQAVINRFTKNGAFLFTLSTNIAVARNHATIWTFAPRGDTHGHRAWRVPAG